MNEDEFTRTLEYNGKDGYQPTNTIDGQMQPTAGPGYRPHNTMVAEAIEKLATSSMMLLEEISYLKKRVKNVEADLRQALEKVSIMERIISSLRAEMPEGSVTDDDEPELFGLEEE